MCGVFNEIVRWIELRWSNSVLWWSDWWLSAAAIAQPHEISVRILAHRLIELNLKEGLCKILDENEISFGREPDTELFPLGTIPC